MSILHTIPSHSQSVISRMIEDEAVLVLPDAGQVKVLNPVGARIWSLIDGKRIVAEIANQVYQEYQVEPTQAEADTCAFLEDLKSLGILLW
jgi:hypothetical protein